MEARKIMMRLRLTSNSPAHENLLIKSNDGGIGGYGYSLSAIGGDKLIGLIENYEHMLTCHKTVSSNRI
jgi:hypothetical protein